jgi:hypothetical protein
MGGFFMVRKEIFMVSESEKKFQYGNITSPNACADRDIEAACQAMRGVPEYRENNDWYWKLVGKEPPLDPYTDEFVDQFPVEPKGIKRLEAPITPLPRSRRRVLVAS